MNHNSEQRPPADPDYEKHVQSIFNPQLEPEEFIARHGHKFVLFNYHKYQYSDKRLDAFIQQVAKIVFSEEWPDSLHKLRTKHLTPAEIKKIHEEEKDGPL